MPSGTPDRFSRQFISTIVVIVSKNISPMILYYVHDPMCSWCWAYRPTLESLRSQLPPGVQWRNLLGGLAPDSDEPMPEATRQMVMGHWQHIQDTLGTGFNFEFWSRCKPRRSTYMACRAVLAAAAQDAEEDMILSIQKAYYLRAMNPSDEEVLEQLAVENGLDVEQFGIDLRSPATEAKLQLQISRARSWPVSGFPSLVLNTGQGMRALPLDYRSAHTTLEAISA